MAVTGTTRADMLVPTFYAPLITKNFETNSIMLGMCDVDTSLIGNAGDKITIPHYQYGNGKCQKLKEGEKIDYKKLTMGSQEITLDQYASGYKIYDRALLASMGDPIGKMTEFIGGEIADTFDCDVMTVAKKTPLVFQLANATSITEDELNEALNLYGDKQNIDEFEGILINPKLKSCFLKMESFTKSTSTTSKKDNGIIKKGILGEFNGIPVIISSKGTYDNTNKQCETLIMKKGALLTPYQRTMNPEQARDIDDKSYRVNADLIAGIGLVNEAGIIYMAKVLPTVTP